MYLTHLPVACGQLSIELSDSVTDGEFLEQSSHC
jgi:hypothetical protein